MPTEKFTIEDLKLALPTWFVDYTTKFEGGQYVFSYTTQNKHSVTYTINLYSSIYDGGTARPSGEDSIKATIFCGGRYSAEFKRVYRTQNWRENLVELLESVRWVGERVPTCQTCGKQLAPTMGKSGKNIGKWWVWCRDSSTGCNWFHVLENELDVVEKTKTIEPTFSPSQSSISLLPNFKKDTDKVVVENTTNAVEETKKKPMVLSPYQVAFLDKDGNICVNAKAGSGKSFTAKLKGKKLGLENTKYCAFNRHIAYPLKAEGFNADTIHAEWVGNVSKWMQATFGCKLELDTGKYYKIIRSMIKDMYLPNDTTKKLVEIIGEMTRMIALSENTLTELTVSGIAELKLRYDIYFDKQDEICDELVVRAFKEGVENYYVSDFNDILYYGATGLVPDKFVRKYKNVIVDEAQDMNRAQQECVKRMVGEVAIVIGDPDQAIYGWSGADSESFYRLSDMFGATQMPLSICYRCGTKHITELAQPLVPDIEPCLTNIEGEINHIKQDMLMENIKPGDLVICRTNAPLVAPAFNLISKGIKAVILGRDIGNGLKGLIKKVNQRYNDNTNDISQFMIHIGEYRDIECFKLKKAEKKQQAENLMDQCECVIAIACSAKNMQELDHSIDTIFSEEQMGVTFSSIHKAKGKEADNVLLLFPELLYPKWGNPTEEKNIHYVAVTRAKNKYTFVEKDI